MTIKYLNSENMLENSAEGFIGKQKKRREKHIWCKQRNQNDQPRCMQPVDRSWGGDKENNYNTTVLRSRTENVVS